jgi:hypothetical protein
MLSVNATIFFNRIEKKVNGYRRFEILTSESTVEVTLAKEVFKTS